MVSILAAFQLVRYFAICAIKRGLSFGELAHLIYILMLSYLSVQSYFLSSIVFAFMVGYMAAMLIPGFRFKTRGVALFSQRAISVLSYIVIIVFIIFSVFIMVSFNTNISDFRYLLFDSVTGLARMNNGYFTLIMYFMWSVTGLYLVGIIFTDKPMLLFTIFMSIGMLYLSRNMMFISLLGLFLRHIVFGNKIGIKNVKKFAVPVLLMFIVVLGNRGFFRSVIGFWEYNTLPLIAFEALIEKSPNLQFPWYSSFRGVELALNPLLEFISGTQRITSQQVVGPVYDYGVVLDIGPWNAFFSSFASPYISSGWFGVAIYGFIFRFTYEWKDKRFQYLHWLIFYFGFRQVLFEDPASVFLILLWLI